MYKCVIMYKKYLRTISQYSGSLIILITIEKKCVTYGCLLNVFSYITYCIITFINIYMFMYQAIAGNEKCITKYTIYTNMKIIYMIK